MATKKTTKKLGELIPYGNNPRLIPEEAVDLVAESIKRFGFLQPIVIDRHNVIVAGHTRYQASKVLGLENIWVEEATDLTPEQIRKYRLVDNRMADLTKWNEGKLATELKELGAALGWTSAEVMKITKLKPAEEAAEEIVTEEIQESTINYVFVQFLVKRQHKDTLREKLTDLINLHVPEEERFENQ